MSDTERAWPVNRARAWLLRKAADMVDRGQPEAHWIADRSDLYGPAWSEYRFQEFVSNNVELLGDSVSAVAEVYGDAEPRLRRMWRTHVVGHLREYAKHEDLSDGERWHLRNAALEFERGEDLVLAQEKGLLVPDEAQPAASLRPAEEIAREMVGESTVLPSGQQGAAMSVTEEQIAAWEQLAREAAFVPSIVHNSECGCFECDEVVVRCGKAMDASRALAKTGAVDLLIAELRRIRSLITSSRDGTVRLLFRDGTHLDVDPSERCDSSNINIFRSTETVGDVRGEVVLTQYGVCHVEHDADEAARERAARLEAERQRAAAVTDTEARVAESLREAGVRLVRSGDPEDQARGAAYLTAAREVAAGQHREPKEVR